MPTPIIAVFPHPSGVYYAHLVDPDAGINVVAPTPFDTNGLAVEHVAARLRKVRGNEDAVIRPHRTAPPRSGSTTPGTKDTWTRSPKRSATPPAPKETAMRLPRIRRPARPANPPVPARDWWEMEIPEIDVVVTVFPHSDGSRSVHIDPLTADRIPAPMEIFIDSRGVYDYQGFDNTPGDDQPTAPNGDDHDAPLR